MDQTGADAGSRRPPHLRPGRPPLRHRLGAAGAVHRRPGPGAGRAAGLASPRSVLDVGCGTGIFADRLDRELAPGGVAGCDLSAGMLAEAAARSPAGGLGAGRFGPPALPRRRVRRRRVHPGLPLLRPARRLGRVPPGPGSRRPRPGRDDPSPDGDRQPTASRRLSSAASKTRVTFPTAAEMRRLATAAGFEVIAQHEVDWRFRLARPPGPHRRPAPEHSLPSCVSGSISTGRRPTGPGDGSTGTRRKPPTSARLNPAPGCRHVRMRPSAKPHLRSLSNTGVVVVRNAVAPVDAVHGRFAGLGGGVFYL